MKKYYANPENRLKTSKAMQGKSVTPKLYGKDHPQYKHGMGSRSERNPVYTTWTHIKRRCLNKNSKEYAAYGAKGITISEDWMIFENFHTDMAQTWFPKASIDRVDNAKGYSKENCRWATMADQARNKTTVRLYKIGHLNLTIPQVAEIYQIKPKTLYDRLVRQGLPLERAIL